MVDVGGKTPTVRRAAAQAMVDMPAEVMAKFDGGEWTSKKGPVFQTAILAGIMAAKKTADLIPLCHPIGLDDCQVDIQVSGPRTVCIMCRCAVTHRTGVEMEALTGASVAALTVYDMCKALSHAIVIREVKLVEKTGGKSDFKS